jgi:disulfide bond formation protein DsbB
MRTALAQRPWLAPLLLALTSAAAILIAVASQRWGGLQPCVLCIWQRWAHGAVIALALIAVAAAAFASRRATGLLTLIAGTAAIAGAGLALYHVGVEQQWWPGTSGCGAGALAGGGLGSLREKIEAAPIIRCSDVPWSLFGISMAGYNALLSAALGLIGIAAGIAMLRRAR